MAELRELQRTERSGVPVWWSDGPGEVTAALCFRVGRSDETLATRGITHLVEHLTLFPLGRPAYGFNGFVDDGMAGFFAWGELDEVCGFLKNCAANLSALPLDRIETECRVLRTEAAGTQTGLVERLLVNRFGARGHGLNEYHELGLRWLGPAEVERWAAERFLRGNAVVWMTAEPPPDLELDLPEGRWRAPIEPEPLALDFPVHIAEGTGGVALGTWGPRSAEASAGLRIAGERVEERLRRDAGLTYGAYGDGESFGGHWRQGIVGADCLDRDAERVREGVWSVVQEMAAHGPTASELEHYARGLRRFFSEPDALRSHLAYLAHDELFRYEVESSATAMATFEALEPAAIAAATAALLPDAIMISPSTLRVPLPGFHPRRVAEPPPVKGQIFRSEQRKGREPAVVVHIGDEGITIAPAEGDVITLLWEGVAGRQRRPEEGVRLFGVDGSWIEISPEMLERGPKAFELIERHLPHLPLVPGLAADNEERLADLVQASIGAEAPAKAGLSWLWDALEEDEEVLMLSQASRDGDTGLLAFTPERVLWTAVGRDEPLAVERPWMELVRANLRKRLLGSARLTLAESDGGEILFEGFLSPDAAERALEAASERIEAVRPPT